MFKEIQLNQSRQVGDGVKGATLFNITGACGGGGGISTSAGPSSGGGGGGSNWSVPTCRVPGCNALVGSTISQGSDGMWTSSFNNFCTARTSSDPRFTNSSTVCRVIGSASQALWR